MHYETYFRQIFHAQTPKFLEYFTTDRHRNKVFNQDLETPIVKIQTIFPNSVSRSGLVQFFSLFWTRHGPVRSSEISFLGKKRTGLGKTSLHRSGLVNFKLVKTETSLNPFKMHPKILKIWQQGSASSFCTVYTAISKICVHTTMQRPQTHDFSYF